MFPLCIIFLRDVEKVETTSFHVLSCGVRISMPVSERFRKRATGAGYAYINLPWIDDKQWHPFSLFEDPNNHQTQQMFLMKAGDWTGAVHTALTRGKINEHWIQFGTKKQSSLVLILSSCVTDLRP